MVGLKRPQFVFASLPLSNHSFTSLTAPRSNTRSWTYDVRNLIVTKTMPDLNDQTTHTHDALRRVTLTTRQDSSTVGFVYDLAGRLTDRTYSGQADDSFTYDPASRLIEAVKGVHAITVERTYADDSTQLTEKYLLDGRTYQLQRTYDDANRVASQTYADGKVMTWGYNARSLVTTATYDGSTVLTQTHDPGYRLTTQDFGNGLTRTITYNRQDNHRTRDEVAIIPELRFDYTYAADKNILAETTPGGVIDSLYFTATYDPGNRLSTWDRNTNLLNARQDQAWSPPFLPHELRPNP